MWILIDHTVESLKIWLKEEIGKMTVLLMSNFDYKCYVLVIAVLPMLTVNS